MPITPEPIPLLWNPAPCGSHAMAADEISSKLSSGWGGARANSGGARLNSGGARPGAGRKPSVRPTPVPEILHWYCVRTTHGAELTADIEIRLAGFTLFAPSLFKQATKPRLDARGAMRPGKPDRIVPLFPRYFFVQFNRADESWRKIRSLPGVERIMGTTPDWPLIVPDSAIAAIRALCAPNGCVYPESHRVQPLAVNTRARLLDGPLANLDGICTWSDGRRVKLLLTFLGRPTLVDVAQDAVATVDG